MIRVLAFRLDNHHSHGGDADTKIIGTGLLGALLLSTGIAHALGLDGSGQDITAIFEDGGYVELGFGFIQPNLTGRDVLGNAIGNVGADYSQVALAFKMDVTDNISLGLIVDQPYGVDVTYGGSAAASMLGGTAAQLDSRAFAATARYRFNENFSAHGGLRYQTLSADVTLSGLAYGGLNG